ncbi:MAG: sigma-70 family RNA polymerase sigma factor [Bacteroidota bacterium]
MTSQQQHDQFKEWLQQHQALLFKVVRAYAKTEADRNDLFQEISLQVWRSVPNFKGKSAVTTWLYRIALHTAMTWKRNEKKHRVGRQNIEDTLYLIPVEQYEPDERLGWLYAEIALLDKVDRSLALLLLDGYSYQEMAQMLGISQSLVGVKIHRIKQRLLKRAAKKSPYAI